MAKRIKLSLREMLYLVALYGDIPEPRREALFRMGQFPAQLPAILADGRAYVQQIALSPKHIRVRVINKSYRNRHLKSQLGKTSSQKQTG
jgi:hypothetical protein